MASVWTRCVAGAALALAASIAALTPASAKPGALNGMWLLQKNDFGRGETPQLTPAALAAAEAARKATSEQDKVLSQHAKQCLPIGMPGFMRNEFALEVLETPGRVTMLSEASSLPRSVYLGRKDHPADITPGWNGHSIGKWEGDVLVIDTVALNDRMSHIPRGQVPSAQTHIVERLSLTNGGATLVNEMTVTDPTVLAAPYKTTIHYDRMPPDAELWEYSCEVDAAGWSERFANDPAAKLKQ